MYHRARSEKMKATAAAAAATSNLVAHAAGISTFRWRPCTLRIWKADERERRRSTVVGQYD